MCPGGVVGRRGATVSLQLCRPVHLVHNVQDPNFAPWRAGTNASQRIWYVCHQPCGCTTATASFNRFLLSHLHLLLSCRCCEGLLKLACRVWFIASTFFMPADRWGGGGGLSGRADDPARIVTLTHNKEYQTPASISVRPAQNKPQRAIAIVSVAILRILFSDRANPSHGQCSSGLGPMSSLK